MKIHFVQEESKKKVSIYTVHKTKRPLNYRHGFCTRRNSLAFMELTFLKLGVRFARAVVADGVAPGETAAA
ncbi:hypothetical protein PV325_005815 [Microctonus aethiopoides]|nr:hypothetical protein PV325_005815 [Microctonus aethiopoides]